MREPLLPKCLDDLLGFGSRPADARDLAVLLDMLGLLPETGPESSAPIALSEGCRDALHHLKQTREINTAILRFAEIPGVLVVEAEGNLTHEVLIGALPAHQAVTARRRLGKLQPGHCHAPDCRGLSHRCSVQR